MTVLELSKAVSICLSQGEPLHLPGSVSFAAVKLWRWDDGLRRLRDLSGEAHVQVMLSSNELFYGDFMSRQLATMRLSHMLQDWKTGIKQNLYLAQAPLTGELGALRTDTATPPSISHLPLQSVNLWMSNSATHSSAHYDPQPNLLCVACGHKQVTLWPPECTSHLAPFPLTSESPNHSSLRIEDRSGFAAADKLARRAGRFFHVHLAAGDALLIPEGWWHEVQSAEQTIAVNFWMQPPAAAAAAPPPHMAPFVLRHAAHACMQAMRVRKLEAARQEARRIVSIHFEEGTHALVAAAELLQRVLTHSSLRAGCADACDPCMMTGGASGEASLERKAQAGHASHMAHGIGSAISLDAAALALLGPRQLIWLLCAAVKYDRSGMVRWFEETMSDLATELFTDSLESPDQDVSANCHDGIELRSGIVQENWSLGGIALGSFAALVESQLRQTAVEWRGRPASAVDVDRPESAVDVPSRKSSDIGFEIRDLFDCVYSVLDSETLLQKLEVRKQRWREGMLAEIRNTLV